MPKNQQQVNPDLVRQQVEKGRLGDRDLARKPGETPDTGFSEADEAIIWDDDQRQLVENQDMNEIEKVREK